MEERTHVKTLPGKKKRGGGRIGAKKEGDIVLDTTQGIRRVGNGLIKREPAHGKQKRKKKKDDGEFRTKTDMRESMRAGGKQGSRWDIRKRLADCTTEKRARWNMGGGKGVANFTRLHSGDKKKPSGGGRGGGRGGRGYRKKRG